MRLSLPLVLGIFGVVVLCLLSAVVGAALTRNFGTSNYTISYADFVSIMLTAISLLMTLLAFFIAFLGVVGWNAISKGVVTRVEAFLEHGFKEGNPLQAMLRERVEAAMFAGIDEIDTSLPDKKTTGDNDG